MFFFFFFFFFLKLLLTLKMNNFYSLISIFPGFNIINAPATGGTTRKCIQFTSNSVSYALKVIGTNPPTLQFMVSAQSIHAWELKLSIRPEFYSKVDSDL